VLRARPCGEIIAAFGHELKREIGSHAMDPGQILSKQGMESSEPTKRTEGIHMARTLAKHVARAVRNRTAFGSFASPAPPIYCPCIRPLRLETAAGLAYPDGSMARKAIAKAAADARDHFSLD
jgi:hypothetical protein